MAGHFEDILKELEAILTKRADEKTQLSDATVVNSPCVPTKGDGKPVPEDQKKGDVDQNVPATTDTDDTKKSVEYSLAKGNEASVKDTAVASPEPAVKAAEAANKILASINELLNGQTKKASTSEQRIAQMVVSSLRKQAQDPTEEPDEEELAQAIEEAVGEPADEAVGEECPEEKKEEPKEEKKEESKKDEKKEEDEGEKAAEYILSKKAGEKAAEEFLARIGAGAPSNEMLSKQAGALAAEQMITSLAEYQMGRQVGAEAAETMLGQLNKVAEAKAAEDKLINLLAAALRKEGAQHPLVPPILSGLLNDKLVTEAEKSAVINYLASAENLDKETIEKATEEVANRDAVRAALEEILQKNDTPAPSPEPQMPTSQPSPPAEAAQATGELAETSVVGNTGESPVGGELENLVVEAALRSALKNLQTRKKKRS